MRLLALAALLLGGCVPYPMYLSKERKLSASLAQRNIDTKNLATCEEKVKGMKETVKDAKAEAKEAAKQKAGTTIIVPAVIINEKELEEIKKKALSDTERRFPKDKEKK